VRSEHDAIKNDYERARRLLVDGNFDAALQLCSAQLARHPGQALFQALQFDVEEQRRQQFSARIAEVDRRVESEPDLEKRVSILTEAVERFPGEPHFERALRTMRDKRELVNSIVNRARALEERDQFAEALAQWEILRTIYSQYPGLDFETERVCRRRDQQARTAAKMRWVEQIDWQVDAGDFARARELLNHAAAEFPGDPELEEVGKQILHGQTRAVEAQKLLADGQKLCAAQRHAEGVSMIEQAWQLCPKNTLIKAALVGALIEHARAIGETDWQAAEQMADRALLLDSANTQAKSLKSLALDRRREQFVDNCVAVARRLQTEGQIDAALEQVERGLGTFPRESRLAQLRATLTKAQAASTSHSASVTKSRNDAAETVALSHPVFTPPLENKLREIAETVAMPAPPTEAPEEPSGRPFGLPTESEPPEATRQTSPSPPPPAAPQPTTAPAPQPQPAATGKLPTRLIAAGIAAVVIIGGGIFAVTKLKRSPIPPPVVTALPPPAAPVVEASIFSTLRVFADVENGKYTLDDQPPVDLQEGQISLDNLAPGKHTLKIVGPREQAAIAFETEKGAIPKIETLTAKEVLAVAVASMSPAARVQSSGASAKITLDGKPVGETGGSGLQIPDLPTGNHEIAIGEGKDRRSMVVGIGSAPMLTAFLKSDRNVGTLLVLTGEDGVHVFLNGKEYRRQTQRGQLRIPNLDLNDYSIRVSKTGFLDAAEQRVAIKKGEESKLEFQLRPVPRMASLSIQGALPGAQVFLDQERIGAVQDDGSFTASSVPPGDHALELRKESYKAKRIEKRFDAGSAVQLAAADVAMEQLLATLRWSVTPADAIVMLGRQGESPKPVSGSSASLPDGSYTLTARAPNHADASQTVTLAAGDSKTVELKLAANVVAGPKTQGMAEFENPGAWTLEASWYVRKGGDFVAFRPAETNGVFLFTLDLRKGKRLQWAASHTDAKNYVLFQMDKKFFYRSLVVNGKETQPVKSPHQAEKERFYTIEMTVSNGSIVNKWYDGSKWIPLDRLEEPGRAFGNGKFGFLIPGGDTIALSNFSFTAK
jgi:tetratricopeptide (TPR) repeat protein